MLFVCLCFSYFGNLSLLLWKDGGSWSPQRQRIVWHCCFSNTKLAALNWGRCGAWRRVVWQLTQAAVPSVRSSEERAAAASALSVSSCGQPVVSCLPRSCVSADTGRKLGACCLSARALCRAAARCDEMEKLWIVQKKRLLFELVI